MIMDNELTFCESLDCSTTVGNVYSTYALDMGAAAPDIGAGQTLYVVIGVPEAFTSGGSATVQFHVIDEEDTTLDDSSVILVETRAIAYTTLTQGKIIVIPLPVGIMTQRYLGLRVTIAGATTTAGTIDAHLAMDAPSNVPIT